MRPSLAAGAGFRSNSRLSWPNVSFAANHRWTCQSIIVIAIDLFTSEDQYFLWIAAVPLFTIPTTFGNAHVRCYTREAPLIQSATQVESSLLDSSMLWLFREAITSPIIVFTSIPTCFAGTNSIAINLITVERKWASFQVTHHTQLVGWVDRRLFHSDSATVSQCDNFCCYMYICCVWNFTWHRNDEEFFCGFFFGGGGGGTHLQCI